MVVQSRSISFNSEPFSDPKLYCNLVGALQYLAFSRPDLSYSVNFVCQFMHAPTAGHFQIVKRILRCIKGTLHYGLKILSTSTLNLYAFFDVNWVGYPTTRRSTNSFCTFLGGNLISWSAKKQTTVAHSSTEAEYTSMASATAELTWLTFLLRDIGVSLSRPPTPLHTFKVYHWSVKMRTHLHALDLWEVVNPSKAQVKGEEHVKVVAPRRQYLDVDRFKALNVTENCVSDLIFNRIMNCTSAKQAWEILRKEFAGNEVTRSKPSQT